ncbi:HisA/HisF-related TIM barrel protein [Amylibacter sp.]|jgi:imidazole glycerol-phosphate synthase subunit HisF|nr:HisA/HisF-related TIM barrel protein [Amylibacter sp.]
MRRPRVIPILCLDSVGELISTVSFDATTYIGDPLNAISIYNSYNVDELGLIDIYASRQGRSFNLQLLKSISDECKTPLFAGGGVSSLNDIEGILTNGAEKVVLSSSVVMNPNFLGEAVNEFGTSSLIVCLDCINSTNGEYKVVDTSKFQVTDYELNCFILQLQDYGLGECIIQSVQNDGLMSGYDRKLLETALSGTKIPIIALGGCSSFAEISELNQLYNVSAFASGSIFSFYNNQREVLLNYPQPNELSSLMIQ